MDFGNLLDDKTKCKAIALRHWNEGKLADNSGGMTQSPLVGDTWPAAFLPYWRQWMAKLPKTAGAHFHTWATVRDVPFWRRVAAHVNDDTVLGEGLAWAGMHGNLCAFAAASPGAIDAYARHVFEPPAPTDKFSRRATRQVKMVHPDVVVFMRKRGAWSLDDVHRLVEAYALDEQDGVGLLHIDPWHRGIWGFKPSFCQDWAVKTLGPLGLDSQAQAQVLGHFMHFVDRTFWTGTTAERCAPLLHPEVDVGMLQLSLNFRMSWSMGPTLEKQSPEMRSICTTVASMANAIAKRVPWVADSTSHPGLALCMDLQGASTPMELYRMAVQYSRLAVGHDARIESTPLPSLE